MTHPNEDERTGTKRWDVIATEYRQALEGQQHLLVTRATEIKRIVVVRFKEPWNRSGTGQVECTRGTVREHVNDRRRPNITEVIRVWVVRDASDPFTEHSRWDRLIMAQAHRDGRMFHYAKYIMTKDGDLWAKELSGGLSTRRS